MKYLGEKTQITQPHQAHQYNYLASEALTQLYSPLIGPNGSLKMLISPSDINLTKDGTKISSTLQFSHPYSIVVSKSALNLSASLGDGTSSFIVLCDSLFAQSYKYYLDGVSMHSICEGIKLGMDLIMKYLDENKIALDDSVLEQLALNSLNTKVDYDLACHLSKQIVKAVKTVESDFFDSNMIEVLKMGEGDCEETRFVNGLVLDHGNRHPLMPTDLENVCLLIGSISLEYEKPEINAQFMYKTADQRDALVASERRFIFERATAIAEFAKAVKERTGKNLVMINEKGIDPISLEVLSNAGVLALRRAKRRNLERLIKMCGGNVIGRIDQLDFNALGYCEKVKVVSFGDDKFTFIEGTPFKGSCTVLVRGNTFEIDRTIGAIKSGIKSLVLGMKEKAVLKGGLSLYSKLIQFMDIKIKEVEADHVIGLKVLRESFVNLAKVLLKNKGENVIQGLIDVERGGVDDNVVDNFCVVRAVISNACILGINLLMVDDIIKAGKPVKEESNPEQ